MARHSYTINDVAFNARPAECVTEGKHGQCVIDFANYHDVHYLDPNIDYDKQRDHLAAGVDVLMGTPGRLIDFLKQGVYFVCVCHMYGPCGQTDSL